MTTNYNEIAEEYKRAKQQPWRFHIEHFTLFKLLGDLSSKSVFTRALSSVAAPGEWSGSIYRRV
jgi:toxoflavin synthase